MRICFPVLFCASVLVTWWANPEPDIAGYTVFCGHPRRDGPRWTSITNAGNQTNFVLAGLGPGKHVVAVSAFNTSGLESELSDPLRFALEIQKYVLTASLGGTNIPVQPIEWPPSTGMFFKTFADGGKVTVASARTLAGPWEPLRTLDAAGPISLELRPILRLAP